MEEREQQVDPKEKWYSGSSTEYPGSEPVRGIQNGAPVRIAGELKTRGVIPDVPYTVKGNSTHDGVFNYTIVDEEGHEVSVLDDGIEIDPERA